MTSVPARLERASDEGSVSVFALGWIVVALMAIGVLVGAGQVHLDRMRLVSLADELAAAAAAQATRHAYETGEDRVPQEVIADAASSQLSGSPREWSGEVAVLDVRAQPDGTVEVALSRHTVPLVGGWSWLPEAAGVTLTAQGSARVG